MLLRTSLSAAVPLHIAELQRAGGPTDQQFQDTVMVAQVLAAHADDLLFGAKESGRVTSLFNMLAKGLAVLAFLPGGVTIFDLHFEASRIADEQPQPHEGGAE